MTDAARCELSDLPITECACRIHAPQPPPPPAGGIIARTTARHPGRCGRCDEPVHHGDPLALVGAHWVHDTCVEDQ